MLKNMYSNQSIFGNVRFGNVPNDILDLSKLKALADDKRNAYQKYKLGFNKEEISVGKGENAGYQIGST